MEIKLSMPPAADLEKPSKTLLEMAKSYQIDSPAMYEMAATDLKEIKSKLNQLDEQRKSITRPLDSAKEAVMNLFRGPVSFLEDAERILKQAMLTYQREEAKKAEEQRRIAEEAARAERQRIEAEARAKAEEAEKLASSGDKRAAEEAHAQAKSLETLSTVITAPAVQSAAPKVGGVSTSKSWKARITDKAALLAYIAEHPECLDWVDVKIAPLNGMARALKGNMKIPGVEAYPEETMSARAA